jgi:hypothetical protein
LNQASLQIHNLFQAIHNLFQAIHNLFQAIHNLFQAIHNLFQAIHNLFQAIPNPIGIPMFPNLRVGNPMQIHNLVQTIPNPIHKAAILSRKVIITHWHTTTISNLLQAIPNSIHKAAAILSRKVIITHTTTISNLLQAIPNSIHKAAILSRKVIIITYITTIPNLHNGILQMHNLIPIPNLGTPMQSTIHHRILYHFPHQWVGPVTHSILCCIVHLFQRDECIVVEALRGTYKDDGKYQVY